MIVLLTGANGFAIRQALAKLTADFTAKHGAHAVERVSGEQLAPTQLPQLLQGASLFASHRLVILRDAGRNKPLWDALGELAERVSAEVVLAIVEPAPDKRTRTFKQIQKLGRVQDFAELAEPQLIAWLRKETQQTGIDLDAATARHLVQLVGLNQWQLYSELQKLVASGSAITRQLIDQLVEPNLSTSAFDLLDAVLSGEGERAATLLARLKASEDPYRLFGLLVSQVQTLALVVSAPSGKSAEAIAAETKLHPFVVRKMAATARRIGYARLQAIIADVALADTQLKSTGADPWVLLAQCVGKIVGEH